MDRILTRGEMAERVASGASDVEREAQRLERAQRTFAAETRWCPENLGEAACKEFHTAQIAANLPALELAERAAAEAATRISDSVRRVLTETNDALVSIAPPDAAEASVLMPLLLHEVASLGLPDLVQRVRTAIADGDKARSYLYSELLPARLKDQAAVAWPSDRDRQAAGELAAMLGQLREDRRDRSFDDLRGRASTVLERTEALRRAARQRARDAAPLMDTYGRPMSAWPTRS